MSEEKLFKEFTFSCKQCGASLVFAPSIQSQKCEYCGFENKLDTKPDLLEENDFQNAIQSISSNKSKKPLTNIEAKCPSCSGKFELKAYQRSTKCPYCNTPVITNIDIFYDLHPEGILPFKITKKEAKKSFKKWIGSLWFAPNDLEKKVLSGDIEGIYIPYWTYDANTSSEYRGQRGDYYYVTVDRDVVVNGEVRRVREQERRVRWSRASGRVSRFFDDVLVGASKSIPRSIIDSLNPWDLENIIKFDEKFLSGFKSQTYQVALDDGFKIAKKMMDVVIRDDVRADIGGDLQRIDFLKTYYFDTKFKYILLPVYVSHFSYNSKDYYFAINARTAKVSGKRPYSYFKIAFLVFIILSVIAAVIYYDDNQVLIKSIIRNLLSN